MVWLPFMNSHSVGKTSVNDPDLLASPTPSQLILIYTDFNIYVYVPYFFKYENWKNGPDDQT